MAKVHEFKWLTAVIGEVCHFCRSAIALGTGFYFEVGSRGTYCRECGRTIRLLGYDAAARVRRNSLGDIFSSLDNLWRN